MPVPLFLGEEFPLKQLLNKKRCSFLPMATGGLRSRIRLAPDYTTALKPTKALGSMGLVSELPKALCGGRCIRYINSANLSFSLLKDIRFLWEVSCLWVGHFRNPAR